MVDDIANWASILSFLVASYAAWGVRKVRKEMIDRVRLPTLVADIRKRNSRLAELMRSFDDTGIRDEISVELAQCEATLRMIRRKVSGPLRQPTFYIWLRLLRFRRPFLFGIWPVQNTREDAWRIYLELNSLIEELKNLVTEQKMGA